jgi:chromosome segregation ATPase
MFVVAMGFAFTSKRGVIKEGDEIAEKDFASKEAFQKALSKKKIIDSKELPSKEKGNVIAAAKQKKETAENAVNAAKENLAAAEKKLEITNTYRADVEAKVLPAREILITKENSNHDIAAARKVLTQAEEELAKTNKPEKKAAAEQKVNDARLNFMQKADADGEYKAAFDNLSTLQTELTKVEAEKLEIEGKITAAKKAIELAEGELKTAAAELSALEGK